MPKKAPFTQGMISRLLRAAEAAGWKDPELEFTTGADGTAKVCLRRGVTKPTDTAVIANDDRELEAFREKHGYA